MLVTTPESRKVVTTLEKVGAVTIAILVITKTPLPTTARSLAIKNSIAGIIAKDLRTVTTMAIEATKGLRLSGPGVLLATLCVSAFRSAEHFNAEARSR